MLFITSKQYNKLLFVPTREQTYLKLQYPDKEHTSTLLPITAEHFLNMIEVIYDTVMHLGIQHKPQGSALQLTRLLTSHTLLSRLLLSMSHCTRGRHCKIPYLYCTYPKGQDCFRGPCYNGKEIKISLQLL